MHASPSSLLQITIAFGGMGVDVSDETGTQFNGYSIAVPNQPIIPARMRRKSSNNNHHTTSAVMADRHYSPTTTFTTHCNMCRKNHVYRIWPARKIAMRDFVRMFGIQQCALWTTPAVAVVSRAFLKNSSNSNSNNKSSSNIIIMTVLTMTEVVWGVEVMLRIQWTARSRRRG